LGQLKQNKRKSVPLNDFFLIGCFVFAALGGDSFDGVSNFSSP